MFMDSREGDRFTGPWKSSPSDIAVFSEWNTTVRTLGN